MRLCAREECPNTFEVAEGLPGGGLRRRFCSDNCRKRACEDRYRAACADCGGPMGKGSAWPSKEQPSRCKACQFRAWDRDRNEFGRLVEGLWAEGLPLREIAKRLGISENHLAVETDRLRAEGFYLQYRYGSPRAWKYPHLARTSDGT